MKNFKKVQLGGDESGGGEAVAGCAHTKAGVGAGAWGVVFLPGGTGQGGQGGDQKPSRQPEW